LHDEQTVNGIRKIAWASVLHYKYIYLYLYIDVCICICMYEYLQKTETENGSLFFLVGKR
jgi:hypothetical protein